MRWIRYCRKIACRSNTERMNIEHRTSNIEFLMGKDEETDICAGRKTVRVFDANYKE